MRGAGTENVARLVEINICMYLRFLTRQAAVPDSSRPPPRRATPRQSATPRPLLISFRLPNSHPVVFSSHLPVPGPKQAGSRGRKSMEGQVDHTSATSGQRRCLPVPLSPHGRVLLSPTVELAAPVALAGWCTRASRTCGCLGTGCRQRR